MELKCPSCGAQFEVDKGQYAALLAQVKSAEFDAEIKRRLKELDRIHEAEEKQRAIEAEQKTARLIGEKEEEIRRLDSRIAAMQGLIDNNEAQMKASLAKADADKLAEMNRLSQSKDSEMARLKEELAAIKARHELSIVEARAQDREELARRQLEISELKASLDRQCQEAKMKEADLRLRHSEDLKAKDQEIEHYRDLKMRMSTKMLGETLEQHCEREFEIARSYGAFMTASFEKDNEVKGGTKGDYIFRDYIGDEECLSIMFEMKNEADLTATKHRNADFFAKLDKDRREKECEYAVLVSTLEADNELYNKGIVDVSHRFEKMYVIRPQFFLPVISLLSQSSRRSARALIDLRSELAIAREQSVDVSKFEARRDKFAQNFMKLVEAHTRKHSDAMKEIDKAIDDAKKQIAKLERIKELFEASNTKLAKAGEAIENDFTIKRLTHGNPTMKARFTEARKQTQTDPTK